MRHLKVGTARCRCLAGFEAGLMAKEVISSDEDEALERLLQQSFAR